MDRPSGLTLAQVKQKQEQFGPNKLPEKPPPSSFVIFFSQFKNPLVYILLAAALVTIFLGELSDTVIISFVVLVNSTLGFVQEKKASNALQSLKSLVHPEARVIRDGKKVKINIEEVVPGDIVELEQGEKIPADGKIIKANRLFVEEAILTGESIPIEKKDNDEVFMGTIVASGEAIVEVSRIGGETEMGKIALHIQKPSEDTPLTKQLKSFSNQLTKVVVFLTIFVFVIGILTGKNAAEMFETSVALAVSSIPEGLLIALTVVLAVGMQRILKKNGLVRSLVSAETLGGVTTICVDKTGTITTGKLGVVEEYGNVENVCYQHFASSDDPVVVAARNWLEKNSTHRGKKEKALGGVCKIVDSIPFKSENRFYATLIRHSDGDKNIYVSGAPEQLLKWSDIKKGERKKIDEKIQVLTREGKRVIGVAIREVANDVNKILPEDVKTGLSWVGLLVFSDPVRKNIGEIFEKTKAAGIKTILITGDYPETAVSVMKEIGVEVGRERVITGDRLEKFSDQDVARKLQSLYKKDSGAIIFARTKPEQKLKVINALKINKEVVAMMGDGVNDAPALHRADIGVVVGEASDVAKESADLILLDSSFGTIVETIREGRGIFENIRKIVLYLMSDAFEEIIAVIGTIVLHLPLPVTAAQILWINVVSDGFPHLSLTVDPKSPGIMMRPPRNPQTRLVANWMKILILIVSFFGGVVGLCLFIFFYRTTGDEMLARSITFATLGINSLVYVFSIRTLRQPFWKENPFDNKWLNLAVFAGFLFQVLPFVSPVLRNFFGLSVLSIYHWFVIIGSSLVMFLMIEIAKHVFSSIYQNSE